MIRANLLPRPKTVARAFGWQFDATYLRRAAAAVSTAASVAVLGAGVEQTRLHGLERVAIAREAALARSAPERAVAKRLALDVARYQAFDREASELRRSGTVAAIAIARIGNTVPASVWLQSLDRSASGYSLEGESASIEALTRAMFSLGTALPHANVALQNIDNHDPRRDPVRFRARLATPPVEAFP